jgi:DtxR family transcriptional regulator, Mn-dependent transcriptional regulator
MAAAAHEPLTRSVEDYLKVIWSLSPEGRPASTNDIAHRLELSAASVSGMIKRLSEQGLLEHAPYKGVQLTDEGRRAALRMVRRHRIIEAYLVGFLGYSWDRVHEEAERLEHAVSEDLVERMSRALGHPAADPHGDPIPTADLAIEEVVWTPLPEVPVGELVELRRVASEEPDRLRYLGAMGLQPGATIMVLARQPFQGPITLDVDGRECLIGHELARSIFVERDQPA